MNLKKLAVLFTATTIMCFGTFNVAFAEDTTDSETSATTEEVEILTSDDGLWRYSVLIDEETKEDYVSIVKYVGADAEVSVPAQIAEIDVKSIGEYAFMMDMNLNTIVTKITIPETLETFDDFSLFGCTALKEFAVDEKNDIYSVKDGVLFGDDEALFICYPPAKPEIEYTVPDGVIALNPAAFSMCSNLEVINLPDSLERMGEFCFSECTALNNVVIPENVSELDYYTFASCTSLTDIKLPEKMYTIGGGAFAHCTALDSIEFPKYIQEIGQAAFAATAFTEIEIPSTVQSIGYCAFGFTTDQQGQIVAMNSFIVKGLENTMAQSYCAEEGNEHITFESTGESVVEESETTESANNLVEKKDGIKPGVIVAIVVGAIAVVTAIVICVVKSKKSSNISDDDEKDSDEDNDLDEENDSDDSDD